MPTEVILPRVDMDMATAKISRWYAEEGAEVEKGSPLFEIETDKAAMEIEAPASGVVRGIVGGIGEDIPIGATVAWILAPGEAPDTPLGARAAPATGAAVGERPAAAPEDVYRDDGSAAQNSDMATVPGLRVTPLARRLAREHGIDLSRVNGSGPRGRIQGEDVLDLVGLARPDTDSAIGEPAVRIVEAIEGRKAAGPEAGVLNHAWLRRGEGPPAVLIHGFGSDLGTWRPFAASLPLPVPILAVDLPGHGKSVLPEPPTLEGFASLIEQTLAALKIEQLHAVGHSLGAAVAITLAARGKVAVRSLLLIAPAGLGPDINGAFVDGFLRARSEPALAPWLRLLVSDGSALPAGLAAATMRQRAAEGFLARQENVAAALFPDGTQSTSVRPLLDRAAIPVKLVFGREDRIIPAHHANGLPGPIALHLFEGVGHLPHFERREAMALLWAELLRSAA
jgi:pyruvate dehydrogenase E2 component (dihydrolipoamide acetyltransferase)